MHWIFRINGIVEILAGIALILKPGLLDMAHNPSSLVVLKMYGLLALSFGLLTLVISLSDVPEKLMNQGALIITGFHLFLSFQLYGAAQSGHWNNTGALGFHLFLAILFIIMFLRHRK